MVIPAYYRRPAEFTEPLERSDLRDVLHLLHVEQVAMPDVFWEHYQQDHDAAAFARAYAGLFEAAFVPSLFGNLESIRQSDGRPQIVEQFHQRLEQRILANAEQAVCHWHLILLVIEKQPG